MVPAAADVSIVSRVTALLDANIFYPVTLRDIFMEMAVSGLIRPLDSPHP